MNSILKLLLALCITFAAALYQRYTGPTYPVDGRIRPGDTAVSYSLPRSHGDASDLMITLDVPDTTARATLAFRRYKADSVWTRLQMQREGDSVRAWLPLQPPAGKLEYFIVLQHAAGKVTIPSEQTVIVRFRGSVPSVYMLPHILFMFTAMLFSNLAGIEALFRGKRLISMTVTAALTLFIGGMILGPVVQKHAFGSYWTGIPFGFDLTDNKTLIAMIGWVIALIGVLKGNARSRWWVLGAAILLLLVYSIPHSMLGSELNYETMEVVTGN